MKNFIKNFGILFAIIWIVGFWFIFSFNNNSSNFGQEDENKNKENILDRQDSLKLLNRIKQAESYLAELENKNKRNEQIILALKEQARKLKYGRGISEGPSPGFEETRRKIHRDVDDLSFYVKSTLNDLLSQASSDIKSKLEYFKLNFQDRINVLAAEVYNLSSSESLGEWREALSIELTNKVQTKFLELQNPKDCETKLKVQCDLNKACGFGCQMHHVMYCFTTAYFTNRTMILDSDGWRYNENGYEAYFKPISDTCKSNKGSTVDWNGFNSDTSKTLRIPIIDDITQKPAFLPLSVPKEFSEILPRLHGEPFVWWAGQILSFLMRFNSNFEKTVEKARQNLKFVPSCVGVHVRRTDKVGSEAAFHGLDEYMKHVKEYYDIIDLKYGKKMTRCVYLATDEVSVLKEAQKDYQDYTFLMDETNAKTASLNQRYSPESAQGVILDIYFLSQCDYLVCTLSSQVCRMALELMQTRFPDASWRFRSLDDVYYFGGQNAHNVMAIYDHVPRKDLGEIELKAGDLIGLAGNHWNGYSKGKNLRTYEDGLFPSYKVKDVLQFF